jgi:predicted phosphodiesterase
MRIAIFSDIHGNTVALDAVLADIEGRGGVDGFWIVGDLAALGPDPVGALERLTELPNATFVRGNTDRYVCTLLDPKETYEAIERQPESAGAAIERLAMLTWAQGALNASGWLNWLAALPLEQRITLPDRTHALLVHAAPGTDDGDGIRPTMSDERLATVLDGCEADLVIVGHTHWQLDRTVGGVRAINLGSVSNQPAPDLRASYYLLEVDESGRRLENHKVEYDRAAVIAQLQHGLHPGIGMLGAFMRGERKPAWEG